MLSRIGPFILKTDEGFLSNDYEEVDTGNKTILKSIPNFGCISSVPLDYMHLILLGVMKKLIRLWLTGPLPTRLTTSNIKKISKKLSTLRYSNPSEFLRKPKEEFTYEKPHNTGPLTIDCENVCQQFKLLKHASITIDCDDDKNRHVLLKDGTFGKVLNIVKCDGNDIRLIIKPINSIDNLYEEPESRLLNIHVGRIGNDALLSTSINNILNKVWRIPTTKDLIIMLPLLH